MITRDEAGDRACLIVEFPTGHPLDGWELQEFSHGWIVRWQGLVPAAFDVLAKRTRLSPDPTELCLAIERDNGLVRYFIGITPQQVAADYDAVRHAGYPDRMWEEPPDDGWGELNDDD